MAQAETLAAPQTKRTARPADPCVMVIFGAGGDLTSRKLIPALYNLAKADLLSREFAIVGISHGAMTNEQFRQKVSADIKHYAGADADQDIVEWFCKRLYYVTGEFDDKKVYSQLKEFLQKVDQDHTTHSNFFFYLATSPNFFGPDRRAFGRGGADGRRQPPLAPCDYRKTFWSRPGFGQDTEPAIAEGRQRKADLPH